MIWGHIPIPDVLIHHPFWRKPSVRASASPLAATSFISLFLFRKRLPHLRARMRVFVGNARRG